MGTLSANIVKGIIHTLKPKNTDRQYQDISWLRKKLIKHQDDSSIKQQTLKYFNILYKRPYELLHTYDELFCKEIYKFSSKNSDPLIIDCGANIGMSVIYFKRLFPTAKVIAFEPDEDNHLLLTKNIALNNLRDVQVHRSAVWINEGFIAFDAKQSEGSSIVEKNTSDNGLLTQVPSIRLSTFLAKFDQIDFLKMDIEGAEWTVLVDAAEQLDKINAMFIEYHGKANDTNKLTDILQLFTRKHFRVYIKNAADEMAHPFIDKRTNGKYEVQLNIFCFKN